MRLHLTVILILACMPVSIVNAQQSQPDGADIFLTYCAGCHGFDGLAAYEPAPSFSMGERLEKDDRELLQSVLKGRNAMPPWENKLSLADIKRAIAYLRHMYQRRLTGKVPRSRPLPPNWYRFKPLGEDEAPAIRGRAADNVPGRVSR